MRLSGFSLAQVEAQLAELVPGVPGVVLGAAEEAVPEGWALVETPSPELVTPGWVLSVRACGAAVRGPASVIDFCDRLPADVGAPSTVREPRATVEALSSVTGDVLLEHPASPLGLLELDNALCTVCGACAIACPTRALTFDDTTLRLDPTACTACGLCVGVCPEAALTVRRGIDTARLRAGVVDLVHTEVEVCSRCGADLPPLPMRQRLRTLLPQLAEAPDDLCTGCAMNQTAICTG
jgi:ferredoxin